MRRVLGAAAIAALALSGLTGSSASAEGPLHCSHHPVTYRYCTAVNAAYDAITNVGGLPTVDCDHPWYAQRCEQVKGLIGVGG